LKAENYTGLGCYINADSDFFEYKVASASGAAGLSEGLKKAKEPQT